MKYGTTLQENQNCFPKSHPILNTREVTLKGYWLYAALLGYLNLKHIACFEKEKGDL
jgi:hypothetical protein